MRLTHVELRRITLPLVTPFRTSYGVEHGRDALLVRVIGDASEGTAECVAMSRPLYTSEYVDGAQHVLRHFLIPRLASKDSVTAAGIGELLAPVRGHPMAKAALEAAVLDAELRVHHQSMSERFGAVRDRVPAGVAVGIAPSTMELLDVVGQHLTEGYRRIKLKICPGWDLEPVRAVRERYGKDVVLTADANAAYTLGDATSLARLDEYGLSFIEQPLPEDDLHGHVELGRRIRTPICLDESITSLRSAVEAVSIGACRIVSIKPGRVGGLFEAIRIHDHCRAHGIDVWCGGMLETGIGRAANLALAALPGFTLPSDLSASARYFHRDITPPFRLEDGHLRVPTGDGIGVEIDHNFIAEITTQRRMIRIGEDF